MQALALGKIAVPVPGTPVQVAASGYAWKVRIQADIAATGRVYAGTVALVAATGVGVIAQFAPAGTAQPGVWEIDAGDGGNSINLSALYVDAAVAAEGALVTAWLR